MKNWDVICSYMDDEIRERVHTEMAPCTEMEFLTRYLELDPGFDELLDEVGYEGEKTIDGYEIIRGKAIAAGDDERQDALFIHKIDDEFGDGDMIVFGYDMPEDADELQDGIFEDAGCWTTDQEVIDTFKKGV